MHAQRATTPEHDRTKWSFDQNGDQLFCVRYRYDTLQRKRFTTVELIVEKSGWTLPERLAVVGLRVELNETGLHVASSMLAERGIASFDFGKFNMTKRSR